MKEKIKEFALGQGAHAVNVGSAADFFDAPEGFKPTDIMSEAKSVIVLGKAMAKGALFSDNKCVYTAQGDVIIRELDRIAHQTAFFLEGQGYAAMPIPADAPYFHWNEERKYGMGILSHRHAAMKAGMGIIGKSGLLIHPVYGSRITLVSILTDAVLAKDELEAKEFCPPSCRKCINNCSVKALDGNKVVKSVLCRSNLAATSDRGHELTNCWNCRLKCPANYK